MKAFSKDCWKILGISKTKDTETIKSAYRRLMKRYHPDMVASAGKKRDYTRKCLQIMAAYKEALSYCSHGDLNNRKSFGLCSEGYSHVFRQAIPSRGIAPKPGIATSVNFFLYGLLAGAFGLYLLYFISS